MPAAGHLWTNPYRSALRDAVRYILDRYVPVGIIAAGTILRGNPSPTSDLDLYVIHAKPERQPVLSLIERNEAVAEAESSRR
jgi:predicted nucleotidyltransferase